MSGSGRGAMRRYCLYCLAELPDRRPDRCPECSEFARMREWQQFWTRHPSMRRAEYWLKVLIVVVTIPSCVILGSHGHPSGYCFALPIAPASGAWTLVSLLTRRSERVGSLWLWGPVLIIVCLAIANIHFGVGVFWLATIAVLSVLTDGLKSPVQHMILAKQASAEGSPDGSSDGSAGGSAGGSAEGSADGSADGPERKVSPAPPQ